MALDGFSDIARPNGSLKMMRDDAVFLIQRIGAEVSVVAEHRLRSVRRSLCFRGKRALVPKHGYGAITARQLRGNMPGLIVDEHTEGQCCEAGIAFNLAVLAPAFARNQSP